MTDDELAREAYGQIVKAKIHTYEAKKLLGKMLHDEQRIALVDGMQKVYDDLDVVVERIKRKVPIP